MDIGTILGATGIVVSAGFGIWGIFLAIKHRYPGKITFVKEQSIGLFDAIAKNLPELSIQYKDSPVSQNLVLLKGALLNSGKIDISPNTIEKPLEIQLPTEYQWLEANIIGSSNNVDASITIKKNNTLTIDTGLFRCGEFIRFQALAEVNVDDEGKDLGHLELGDILESTMKFVHRIANTGKVIMAEVEPVDRKRLRRRILVPTIVGFMGALALGSTLLFPNHNGQLVYKYEMSDSTYTEVSIKPKSDGMIEVKGINVELDETWPSSTFFKKTKGIPTVKEREKNYYVIFFGMVSYLLIPFFFTIPRYYSYRKNKFLMKTLEIENTPPNNAINSDS